MYGPSPIDTIRQILNMTGGASYLTPADAAKISKKNVPPPAEQPQSLRYGQRPAAPMAPAHPAHRIAQSVIDARSRASSFDTKNPPSTTTSDPPKGFDPMGLLAGMVTALLKGGSPNQLLGTDLADAAAAPSTALAHQLQSTLDNLPNEKAQALANIANWYGQVGTAEKNAASKDSSMADSLASAMTDNTKGIAAGLGGAAMPGSAQIGAMGANDANAMKAIGASDASLASDLAPIFALAQAGASDSTSGKFDAAKTSLENQLATANGQASADKAAALMQIIDANNKTRQSNFSNEAGLLNTLASLQISGANAATKAQSAGVLDALRAAEAKKTANQAIGGFDAATSTQKAKVAQAITSALVDPTSHKLLSGMDWPSALRTARNVVRTNGWNPLDPSVVSSIISPALSMAGVSFTNPQVLYQP